MDRDPNDLADPPGGPLALPPHPAEPSPPGFPWLATVAPVAGALVLLAVTGSTLSLAFAALGPLVAVASVLDARRQGRRARRMGAADRAERLGALRLAVAVRHDQERASAWRRVAPARRIVEHALPIDWRDGGVGHVVLGRGTVRSTLRIDGAPVDALDREVLDAAARLDDAPVLAPAELGIGVVGPSQLARSFARALIVQVANRCRPGAVEIAAPAGDAWSWAANLPHRHGGAGLLVLEAGSGPAGARGEPFREAATIAVADEVDLLPPGLETVVEVESPARAHVERRSEGSVRRTIVPDLLTATEAGAWASAASAAAIREGVGTHAALPDRVALASLVQPATPAGSRATLRVAVGVTAEGVLELDLVGRGPHAIVAGTTGSGKSEFLLAWLTAMARCHPPDRVSFLLVDFKGGAAFEPIRDLPHVTGIVTDLDEAEAERAMLSLRSELRHRESVLAEAGVRDVAQLPPAAELARLVLVVDEFQAMIERFPELGVVVADIAARGRSLGVHLVLASQRPNGVVREQVSANCAIRVSLRVMQRADSLAVVGSDAAAAIGPETPGRGVVDPGDGRPIPFQSAWVEPVEIEGLLRSTAALPRARRPWVGRLPDRLSPADLDVGSGTSPVPQGALVIGLADEPERQRHERAVWTPAADGHLLVVGGPGSGRSTLISAVERAGAAAGIGRVIRIAGTAARRWDDLTAVIAGIRTGAGQGLVLIDDLDVAFRDWPDDHRHAASDMVETILREGRRHGVAVAATAGSAHRLGAGIREGFGQTVLLRHPSRSDLVQAGGAGRLWRADDPPGSGQWRGRRVQFVDAGPSLPHAPAPVPSLALDPAGFSAVVTASPRTDAAVLRALGHEPVLLEPSGDAAVRVGRRRARPRGRRRAAGGG